ncbi:acyl-CoA dehydrogenase family protein [Alienimonas californiensis]|uniref:Glutaryl-CoA dehydrogenase n=1 Tax=Alienimonas californiensis TaxID=2527989 RepID=A0A517PCV3_9PLAN|nr:acyl-CoA dehydrogenase [Alienimonas californiensis]QDT17207.1 Glutaryl-CoA dehydrogenase [Alienimonas californiensis]
MTSTATHRTSLAAAAFLVVLQPILGQDASPPDPLPEAAKTEATSTAEALTKLQERHESGDGPFVEMDELNFLIRPGGGGSCASAAGLIVLQAGRALLGRDAYERPHMGVLGAFQDQPTLLNGRVTNNEFVDLLEFYERHLGGGGFSTETLSAPNSPHAQDGNVWTAGQPPPIAVREGQLQVLSYTVTTAEGDVLGRHFVILKAVDGNRLDVLDPAHPKRKTVFVLEDGDNGCGRMYLRLPPEVLAKDSVSAYLKGLVNELNTVFTITVEDAAPPRAPELGDLKRRIDETAEELRAEGKLTDPRAWRKAGAAYGLPGLDLPGELGGSGWSASEVLPVFRHAGRHNLNLRDVVGGAHARALLNSDEKVAQEVVRETACGEAYVAITITEEGFGTDYTSMTTKSKKVDGGYVLSGEKRWNARLREATDVVGITKASSGEVGKLSVFLLERETPGLTVKDFAAHGLTGNSYGGLVLDDVFVPSDRLLGVDGEGKDVFTKHFLYWRLMQVAAAIGCGDRALEQMAERMKERKYRGAPLARMTHLQQQLAQSTTELAMAYSLAKDAAELLDEGKYDEAAPLINGLKAEGVEAALRAADFAMRAHGALGYSTEVDLGDRVRDLMGLRIADGTTDAMRSAVVADVYGSEFWWAAFPRNPQEITD